jgi:excisionase family DNA binding protein
MATPLPDLAALLAQLAQALAEQNGESASRPVTAERPMPARVLLTVDEAAEQLGIGRTLAWRLVSDGELESVQIGRLRRVPASAITDYAAQLVARQSAQKSA